VEVLVVADRPGVVPGLRVLADRKGLVRKRLDAREGTTYLLRPDQHVCARMRSFDAGRLRDAVRRATCTA
jgi:3-(3-hydroxy-phenyl)propionate hydroxylase